MVGLLFYIPEHNETKIRNSEFSAPSGSTTLVVVIMIIIVVVIVVTPQPPWPPPHDFQISSKFNTFYIAKLHIRSKPQIPTRFEVHKYFSHNTLCLWVSFSTSLSKHKAHIENPKFLTPGGGEIIVVIIIIVVPPTSWPPPHDFQKIIIICKI